MNYPLIIFAAGNPNKNDAYEYNLKGNIKSVRHITYHAELNNDSIINGKCLADKNDENNFLFAFNDKGNIIERSGFNSDGKPLWKEVYKCDDKNNIMSEEKYDKNGKLISTSTSTFKYNEKGKKMEKNYPDGRKIIYTYDNNENLSELHWYKPDGSTDGKEIYIYDDLGNVIDDKSYDSNGNISFEIIYKYNDKNFVSEETWYGKKSKFIIKYLSKYDDYGNMVEIDWLKKNGKSYANWKHKYVYDTKGNWIRCVGYNKNKPDYVMERTIAYFN